MRTLSDYNLSKVARGKTMSTKLAMRKASTDYMKQDNRKSVLRKGSIKVSFGTKF